MYLIRYALCCAAMMALTFNATAQERSAGGTMETQMTWSTLKALADKANANSDAANARIDQIVTCSKKGMDYAPGADADADGCIGRVASGYFMDAQKRVFQPTSFTVKKGETITFKVAGKIANSIAAGRFYEADDVLPDGKYKGGCPLRGTLSSSPLLKDTYDYSQSNSASVFCVKDGAKIKASAAGELYLGVPEGGSNSGDNIGGFDVSYTKK